MIVCCCYYFCSYCYYCLYCIILWYRYSYCIINIRCIWLALWCLYPYYISSMITRSIFGSIYLVLLVLHCYGLIVTHFIYLFSINTSWSLFFLICCHFHCYFCCYCHQSKFFFIDKLFVDDIWGQQLRTIKDKHEDNGGYIQTYDFWIWVMGVL